MPFGCFLLPSVTGPLCCGRVEVICCDFRERLTLPTCFVPPHPPLLRRYGHDTERLDAATGSTGGFREGLTDGFQQMAMYKKTTYFDRLRYR